VVVLTTFDLGEYVYAALRAGASGFRLKDAGPTELLQAIRTVAAGGALLAPSITRRLIAEFAAARSAPTPRPVRRAYEREQEILRLVAAGVSNTDIARLLVIQPSHGENPCQPCTAKARLPRPRPARQPPTRTAFSD
jgi:DNA-binding NarL/FixJ family response regulator